MIECKRTSSDNVDFIKLVAELDKDLRIRDGNEHSFYAQYNKVDAIKHVIVAYERDEAVGCGSIKKYDDGAMEVKRMFVIENKRGQGIASVILAELEKWATELCYEKCILETGKKQLEAIALYKKNGYKVIPNYGQYIQADNSICFEKTITPA